MGSVRFSVDVAPYPRLRTYGCFSAERVQHARAVRPRLMFLKDVQSDIIQWPIFARDVLRQEEAYLPRLVTLDLKPVPWTRV